MYTHLISITRVTPVTQVTVIDQFRTTTDTVRLHAVAARRWLAAGNIQGYSVSRIGGRTIVARGVA